MPEASGRRAEAARNDERILAAARAVFVEDPSAPIAAVAGRAGVGIGALYRRFASKEDLLRALCAEGLRRYTAAVEAALADDGDPWESFAGFMRAAVAADASSLTVRLAGTFTPTPELYAAAAHAGRCNVELFERTRAAGAIRPDADVNDLALVLEQLASIRLGDAERTQALRRRYLELALDGLHAPGGRPLPGPPPGDDELTARWER
ncbi:MAG TPA: helix-turn-helix domain-containing protein [Solirubrobacteraceae bacterium]